MSELDRIAATWQEQEKQRQQRLGYALRCPCAHSYIWLYESGPLDYFGGWDQFCCASHIFYEEEKKGIYLQQDYPPVEEDRRAMGKILSLEQLLIEGLLHFASEYLLQKHRTDNLKYCVVDLHEEKEFGVKRFFVICLKMDNNGTCYAFSRSEKIAKLIPNDSCEWQLHDAKIIQT